MPGDTTRYSWPYQSAGDAPDGPALGQDLAEAVEATVGAIDDRTTTVEGKAAALGGPLCRLVQQAAQSVNSGANAGVTFGSGSEDIKTDAGMHSTSVNPTRVTPPKAGYYEVTCHNYWAFNTVLLYCDTAIFKNGVVYARSGNIQFPPAANQNNVSKFGGSLTEIVPMNGTTDYLEMSISQVSTGAVAVNTNGAAASTTAPRFTVRYVRPLTL